jgi:hypothetical protein
MVEPGLAKGTSLFRNVRGLTGAVFNIMKSASAHPVDVAARTYIDAAAVKGKESHGCFLVNCEIHPYATVFYNPETKAVTDRLWEETLDEFRFVGARETIESFSK